MEETMEQEHHSDRRAEDRRGPADDGREHRRHRRRSRKERVLHTRVSDALADDIRRMADDLRVPASNLVRNVLEEVFAVVETVSDDVGGLFEDLLDEAEATRDRIRDQRSRGRGRRRRHGRGHTRESAEETARDRELWRAAREEADEAEFRIRPTPTEAHPTSPPPLPVDWHIAEDGRSVGPFRADELAAAIRAGRVRRDTPVWCAGMSDWLAADHVAALEPLFSPPPPPAASAASPEESHGAPASDPATGSGATSHPDRS
jgi:hypothetical protein